MTRAAIIVAALCLLVAGLAVADQTAPPELARLRLELGTNKPRYLPGELVELHFLLSPRSAPALAPASMSTVDGSLSLLVLQPPDAYLEYQGPGWGVKRTTPPGSITLNAGESVRATGTLLYNEMPPTSHLSPMYAAAELEGRIRSEYALPAPGSFLLKAVYQGAFSGARLESTPVRIVVTEPVGEDAEVWRILKADSRLAYVLQTGTLPEAATTAQEDRILATLTDILKRHPSSTYAPEVRNGLGRFQRAVEAKRRTNARAR